MDDIASSTPVMGLGSFLREGLRLDELAARSRHFAQSAQAAEGGKATPLARDALANALAVFLAKLRCGISIVGHPAHTVTVFDTFCYRIDAERTGISLHRQPDHRPLEVFDAGSPMRTFAWVAAVDLGAVMDDVDEDTRLWIQNRVTRFARRHIDGIALRRALSTAFALCPRALLRARRVAGALPGVVDCPAAWLRESVRSAAVLDEIHAIAPGILPLVACLNALPAQPLQRDVLQRVQGAVHRAGGSPADWDRLVKSRPRVLWESLRKGTAASWIEPGEFVAAWCRAHRGLPPTGQLTRGMWLTLLRPNGEGVCDALTLPNYWPDSPRLIQSAMAASLAARASGRHTDFLHDWARVIRWRADFMKRGITVQPRSFPSALRRARQDERRARAEALASLQVFPGFPVQRWAQGDWEAVDLDTPLALVEQAIDQAHCGETLVVDCASGRYRVFAVRDTHTQRSIGTVALALRGHRWLPANAKHFANRPPSPALVGFLFRLAQAVAKQRGQRVMVSATLRRSFARGSSR